MLRQWLINREVATTAAHSSVDAVAQTARFRNRGMDVSRLEGFSDAVFGFAITLLVVSLQPPNTFADLIADLQRLPAFAASFSIILFIWFIHYSFFRRYGLSDATTMLLNMVLLFVVLFYVYPLRFVFELAFAPLFGSLNADKALHAQDTTTLYLLYSSGYMAVFIVFALLYTHAYHLRRALDLTAVEQYDTITAIAMNSSLCLVGLISVALALGHVGLTWGAPGFAYFLIWPAQMITAIVRGRGRRPLEVQALQQASEKVDGKAPVQAMSATSPE